MRSIVYYVATSLDGYISGPDEDISGFVQGGSGVEQYLRDLQAFDLTIMGRKTYEFGYRFGLAPGKAPYPHMQHVIFSRTLRFDAADPNVEVVAPSLEFVRDLKRGSGSEIYLCGGGELAGWLLDHELIDFLKIKLNPLILGVGVRLFGRSEKQIGTELIDQKSYDHGLQFLHYRIKY